MDLNQLLKFIELEDKRLRDYYKPMSDEQLILARTVKLSEELGELCDEVLSHCSLQREQKLSNHEPDNMPEEFADVIITLLLLGRILGINIKEALTKKINKINNRYS